MASSSQSLSRNKPKPRSRRFERLRNRSEAELLLKLVRRAILNQLTALGKISAEKDSSPFKVLISTILSARTKDPVTEEAAARLFARFPDAESLSEADPAEVSKIVKPVLYYNVKAERVIEVAKEIEEKYRGKVPNNLDDLLTLPGVGRKTANCVLVYAFRTPAIPVDVHVHRISNRIGLVRSKTPEETEVELSKLYEKRYWLAVNELFVKFGQTVCKPVVPRCEICPVRPYCNYYHNEVRTGKRPSSF